MRILPAVFAGCLLAFWLSAPGLLRADDADDQYNFALGMLKQERFKEAAQSFEVFLKEHGKHPKAELARLQLGLTYLRLKDYMAARKNLRTYVANNPKGEYLGEAMYQVAYTSYVLSDMENARREFAAFHSKFPKDEHREWSLAYEGYVLLQLKQTEAARKSFELSESEFPKGAMREDVDFGLARVSELSGRTDDAVRRYRKLADDPAGRRRDQALMKLGNLYYDRKDFAAAAGEYTALADKYASSELAPSARLNAGYSYYQAKDYKSAAAAFEQAEEAPSQRVTAQYWNGLSLKQLHQWSAAVESLSAAAEALGEKPASAIVRFHWADCLRLSGDRAKAIPIFVSAADADPEGKYADDSLYFASESALEEGDVEQAQSLFARLRQHPEVSLGGHVELLQGRIDLAEGTEKKLKSAEAAFRDVVERGEPASLRDTARYQLARTLSKQNRCNDAVELLDAWTADFGKATPPELLDALLLQAECLRRLAAAELTQARPLRKQIATLKSSGSTPDADRVQRELDEKAARSEQFAGRAEETLNRYVALRPDRKDAPAVLLVRAVCEAIRGRKNQSLAALESLRSAATADETSLAETTYEIAEIVYDRGDYTWSRDLYKSMTSLPEDSYWRPIALSGEGWSEYQLKEYADAANSFGALAETYPGHELAAEASYMRADSLRADGRTKQAAAAFAGTFENYSKSSEARVDSGPGYYANRAGREAARLYAATNDAEQADAVYQSVFDRFPKQSDLDGFLNEWAATNANAGRYGRSDELYRRLLDRDPESRFADTARMSLAESSLQAGKTGEARKTFAAFASNERADPIFRERSLLYLIGIAVQERQWDEVLKRSDEFTERFPESPRRFDVAFYRADALIQLDRIDDAVQVLASLYENRNATGVKDAAWLPRVWVFLAETAVVRKEYDRVAALAREFENVPGSEPFQYQMREIVGRSLKNQAKFDEAITEFNAVIDDKHGRKTPTAAKAQFLIGEIWMLRQKYDTALQEYMKVYLLYKIPEWQAPALYQAGRCDEALRQWTKALTSYENLRRDFPKSEFAAKADERIAEVKRKIKK